MLLYHASPLSRVQSIDAHGLLVAKAEHATKAIWLCTKQYLDWAIAHVAQHRNVPESQLAVFVVEVPRRWLRRKRRGIWLCPQDIPAGRIQQI